MNAFLIGCIIGLLIMIVRLGKQIQELRERIESIDSLYSEKLKQIFYYLKDNK